MKSELIEDIYCFIISNNKLNLVNSSSFIWEYDFNDDELIKKIKASNNLFNEDIKIDNVDKNRNFLIYTNVEDKEYIFVLTVIKPLSLYYQIIGLPRIFGSSFNKIGRILVLRLN
ncbi:hypothetical protein [Flavobacterium sp. 7A]|uniref:hypothetical protein n=1 Tax=Flavobacterium sp. 7A TaxID=2940571 RepID=UPI002225D8CE|nr:hypothetical protein [Flavobacterium sp. 7A]MCW2119204.1 hypothetical protein [Flavobacterium sp. 7A]